jgi:hypothetical protein
MRASGDSESVGDQSAVDSDGEEPGSIGLHDGLRGIQPSRDSELKSVRIEHRSVLKTHFLMIQGAK